MASREARASGVDKASLLAIALTSAVTFTFLSCAPAPSSYEDARARFQQQLAAMPEFQEARGQRSAQEAEVLSWQLSRRGLHRLSNEQLLLRATLRSKALKAASTATCAAIVRDKPTEAQMQDAFGKLDDKDTAAFFSLFAEAIRAELQHQPPPTVVSEADFPTAFGALLGAVPQDQAERLAALLSRGPTQTSDEEVCWAERTFLTALLSLSEPYRGMLARAVVQ